MTSSYIALSSWDLVLAATLMLINGVVSWAFSLKLERTLFFTSVRMVIQLLLVGLVLKWIFAQTSPLWTVSLALVMVAIAGTEIVIRQKQHLKTWQAYGLGTTTMLFTGIVVTAFAVAGIIAPEPWYEPRYILPILGMVLGNSLTGVSLVFETIIDGVEKQKSAVDARLALGHPRFVALETILRDSLRTGLMPILNAMAVSGIVALPGMMTGQILAGADPIDAAKYQVMIMFIIAGATALSVVIAGFGAIYLITDSRHRLRIGDERAPVVASE